MKLTFVLPFLNWTGGVRVTFELAERLQRRGHSATVIFPLLPYRFNDRLYTPAGLRRWAGDLRLNLRRGARAPQSGFTVPVRMVPWIGEQFMPDADVVVATAWPTALSIARLSASKGCKVHHVFHYEIDTGPAHLVDAALRLPFFRIAISSFTAETLQRELETDVDAVVPLGIDTAFWRPPPGATADRAGVLMFYGSGGRKGGEDGIQALKIVRECHPDVRISMFGPHRGPDVPTFVQFVQGPPDPELRDLYGRAKVFLYPSRYEGYGLPPMEAMACGAAVVSTKVGAVPDYTVPGETALVVEPRDVQGMAGGVSRLLQDDEARRRIAEAGLRHIQQFTWERAVERFEAALARGIVHSRGELESSPQRA